MNTKANLMCSVPPRQRPPQGSAAKDHAAARLCRLRPCPARRPAAVEMGLQEIKGDPDVKARTLQAQGPPLQRGALTRIDKVDCAIIEITHSSS
jgi:hypothetical protein